MAIDKTLHQAEFTAALIGSFRDNNQDPFDGLGTLFPSKVAKSKYVKVHVMRNGRKVAVDIKRCTDARLNQFQEGKEKIIYYSNTSCAGFNDWFRSIDSIYV